MLAAAKRNSVLKQNGEYEIISGDKRPIGGGESGVLDFTMKKLIMKRGDALYFYSDGYTDQFGGPNIKKIKTSGVLTIIKDLPENNISTHGDIIEQKLKNWQGELNQIDDILFIGLYF